MRISCSLNVVISRAIGGVVIFFIMQFVSRCEYVASSHQHRAVVLLSAEETRYRSRLTLLPLGGPTYYSVHCVTICQAKSGTLNFVVGNYVNATAEPRGSIRALSGFVAGILFLCELGFCEPQKPSAKFPPGLPSAPNPFPKTRLGAYSGRWD